MVKSRENKKITESNSFCAECMKPLKYGLDADARQFFSDDLFCHCRERA